MTTHGDVDWSTLRDLCDETGIGEGFRDYEEHLPNLITEAIVTGTATTQRYLMDAEFHANVTHLVMLIVMALTKQKHPPVTRTVDMEALNKVFLDEFKASRE